MNIQVKKNMNNQYKFFNYPKFDHPDLKMEATAEEKAAAPPLDVLTSPRVSSNLHHTRANGFEISPKQAFLLRTNEYLNDEHIKMLIAG